MPVYSACFASGRRRCVKQLYSLMADVKPLPGESLISFAWRSCVDFGYYWPDYQRLALGVTFRSSRLAERRYFEWPRLEQTLGVPAEDLFEMTERSFYTSPDDARPWPAGRQDIFPWLSERGYPIYSPAELKRGDYLRKAWLKPHLLVDPESETLYLQQCPQCGRRLRNLRWYHAAPCCPAHGCDTPLVTAPAIRPERRLLELALEITSRYDEAFIQPIDPHSVQLSVLRAVYHAAEYFATDPALARLCTSLLDELGLAPLRRESADGGTADPAVTALVRAHTWLAADHACTEYADVTLRRYDPMRRLPRNLVSAPNAVLRGLHDLAAVRGLR